MLGTITTSSSTSSPVSTLFSHPCTCPHHPYCLPAWCVVLSLQLCEKLGVSQMSVNRDLDTYRGLLTKLTQAKDLLQDFLTR